MQRLSAYMWGGIALASIAVLIWLILRIRSWFFESEDNDGTQQEMLAQFRQLRREGELSDEEYRLITQRLSGQPVSAGPVKHPSGETREEPRDESDESSDPPDGS